MNEIKRILDEADSRTEEVMRMARSGGVTIGDLPAASAAELTDLIEIQKGSKSQKLTLQQVSAVMGGGGGGASDYNALTSKPQINGVELSGNKTSADLRLASASEVVKTAGDQNVGGVKTFTDGIKGTFKSTAAASVLSEVTLQGEKKVQFDMIQPQAGFVNYAHWEFRHKQGSQNPVVVFSVSARDNYNKAYATALNNVLQFVAATKISGVAAPTDNSDAANKQYVDAIKAKIKEAAAGASDFNVFKQAIAAW